MFYSCSDLVDESRATIGLGAKVVGDARYLAFEMRDATLFYQQLYKSCGKLYIDNFNLVVQCERKLKIDRLEVAKVKRRGWATPQRTTCQLVKSTLSRGSYRGAAFR